MPAFSTLATFIDSLRTGQTNITRILEALLSNRAALREHPEWPTFRDNPVLDQPMPSWLRDILIEAGMRNPEVNHIDDHWPSDQKELARRWIVDAIQGDFPLQFRWELHDGNLPVNIRNPADQRLIVFKSPRAGVRLSQLNFGSVHVDA